MKQRFYIGDRVKVRVATDVIPEEEIANDEGMVYGIILKHPGAPKFHTMRYKILLDGPYGKVIFKKKFIEFEEGFNIKDENQSIELVRRPNEN